MCTTADVMIARSLDGGWTWSEPRSLSHLDVAQDGEVWVIPQISALADGRLVIICDRGIRRPGEEHVSLFHWQQPERGMSSWLFWSDDAGETWSQPERIDKVGGQPSYIAELADGTLLFTRTEAKPRTDRHSGLEFEGTNPPYAYYACGLMASYDRGRTWDRPGLLADDPLFSDAEVGLFETREGILQAHARCCDHGSFFGQPSRRWTSEDGGRNWSKPELLPYYGHRIAVHALRSGKALATFRNAYGTFASYAFLFDPGETFAYVPNSFIWREDCCRLEGGELVVETGSGTHRAVEFVLYPAEDTTVRVELEFEMRLEHASERGCCVSAGGYLHFQPGRIWFGDRPEVSARTDTAEWHRYRVLRDDGMLCVWQDGELLLQTPADEIATRLVRFGNRVDRAYFPSFSENRSRSFWRSFRASIRNRDDHPVVWNWTSSDGYPDQFRRDRLLLLDRSDRPHWADHGYSGWTQLPDESIVAVDYTAGYPAAAKPFVRAYHLSEEDWKK
jgi:hypothetical protein